MTKTRQITLIIITVIALLAIILGGLVLYNRFEFDKLTDDKVDVFSRSGVFTVDKFISENPNKFWRSYGKVFTNTKITKRQDLNYGVFSLGKKATCLFNDGEDEFTYYLYEVDPKRTLLEAQENAIVGYIEYFNFKTQEYRANIVVLIKDGNLDMLIKAFREIEGEEKTYPEFYYKTENMKENKYWGTYGMPID